jgi:3-isopropylmalate/(R)-2-methylmalate dehydratase small subunit
VIARNFARIFFRNAINIGLPIFECPEAVDATEDGDVVSFDMGAGTITNETKGLTFQAEPFPEFMLGIMEAGGLVEYTKRKLTNAS